MITKTIYINDYDKQIDSESINRYWEKVDWLVDYYKNIV